MFTSNEQFLNYIKTWTSYIQWYDEDVHSALDQHALFDLYTNVIANSTSMLHAYVMYVYIVYCIVWLYVSRFKSSSELMLYCWYVLPTLNKPYYYYYVLVTHWNNSPRAYMSLHSDTLSWFGAIRYLLFMLNAVCLAEEQQIPTSLSIVQTNILCDVKM